MTCRHPSTEFGRVMYANGEYHIMERCAECKENVRGGGVWVQRRYVPCNGEHLPIFIDHRNPIVKQRSMF